MFQMCRCCGDVLKVNFQSLCIVIVLTYYLCSFPLSCCDTWHCAFPFCIHFAQPTSFHHTFASNLSKSNFISFPLRCEHPNQRVHCYVLGSVFEVCSDSRRRTGSDLGGAKNVSCISTAHLTIVGIEARSGVKR